MTLDDRLRRAREDYRTAVPPDRAGDVIRLDPPRRPGFGPGRMAVAGLMLMGLIGALALLFTVGRDAAPGPADRPEERVESGAPRREAQPDGAVAQYDPTITLAPEGPYVDRQSVELRVPVVYAEDLINGGTRMCATLADAPGGPAEACDPLVELVPATGTTSVTTTLSRSVFTPLGPRDYTEPEVTCRFVVRTTGGASRASAPLTFEGDPIAGDVALAVTATDPPGTFTIRPRGLEPDPSWRDLRDREPARVEGSDAFVVQLSAFTGSGEVIGPFGDDLWTPAGPPPDLPPSTATPTTRRSRSTPTPRIGPRRWRSRRSSSATRGGATASSTSASC